MNTTATDCNVDQRTVDGFGQEWTAYDQSTLPPAEHRELFEQYFAIFPWHSLPAMAVGFDLGCGSGRWAQLVAPRVGTLHCIDASGAAIGVARRNLAGLSNCQFHEATVDRMPLADQSMDFGYSLGVLHHVPETGNGIRSCVSKLRPGAPLLLYLYYALDNRPCWFRALWIGTNWLRQAICRLPSGVKRAVTTAIAAIVYYPLARCALAAEKLGACVDAFPLSYYRRRSFYTMRTDALDRFGTRLEQRFTAQQVQTLMQEAGLERITFSESAPYWCAVGFTKRESYEGRTVSDHAPSGR
jgi:SAM-dependent methyltransferase